MVVLECLSYGRVHVAKLRTMALVKNEHYVAIKNSMFAISTNEPVKFLISPVSLQEVLKKSTKVEISKDRLIIRGEENKWILVVCLGVADAQEEGEMEEE